MTPQERQLLEGLIDRISRTAPPQKDAEAEALIRQKLGTVPDALYVLTQTVLIQEMALNQANTRLHELEQQIASQEGQQSSEPTSFLGRLFGTGRPAQPPRPAPPPPAGYAPSAYPPPPYGAPAYAPSPYGYEPAGGGSSFLRNAAMTATGVAAGALAFEGIESLLGHHGGWGGGGGYDRPSETVVNNYYDDRGGEERQRGFLDSGSGSDQDFDSGQSFDSGQDFSSDASDDDPLDLGPSDDFSSTDV